ncbi:hypothetical protein CHCC20441_1231 [Bacillus licheniformis]|uniref:Uncharacterized protein n=1 Tax=Bacillus licheniformis TaxID=1402 RepID=A0A8B5YK75_BACLI|nr:hypothetical protein B4092_3415 [Bacillus licheniformis]KYC76795.1 hypothetical protein B4090_3481 [Bacillus licheniformis]KYC79997.1 hypothetical protein B4091_3394 [Bacillus licheniformis]KYC93201.1 hypothetical protein B4164_3083 [Bacillus licheniformis]OLF86312.1 hypothetical protein B4094_4776 [Bacillus licheniformis]
MCQQNDTLLTTATTYYKRNRPIEKDKVIYYFRIAGRPLFF